MHSYLYIDRLLVEVVVVVEVHRFNSICAECIYADVQYVVIVPRCLCLHIDMQIFLLLHAGRGSRRIGLICFLARWHTAPQK